MLGICWANFDCVFFGAKGLPVASRKVILRLVSGVMRTTSASRYGRKPGYLSPFTPLICTRRKSCATCSKLVI